MGCSPSKPGDVGSIPSIFSLSDETLNQGPMIIFQDKLLTCDEAGDYVVPTVLMDLGFRLDIGHKLYHHHMQKAGFLMKRLTW